MLKGLEKVIKRFRKGNGWDKSVRLREKQALRFAMKMVQARRSTHDRWTGLLGGQEP